MNITTQDLHEIRKLLSKEDKDLIAEITGKSVRTVGAVLQGDRVNDEIERECVRVANDNHNKLEIILEKIDSKNS